ncbi:hypothetical protein [Bacillus sp. V5-8f]|nr:hypothetical protein [Bacillus sp. V5-8f]
MSFAVLSAIVLTTVVVPLIYTNLNGKLTGIFDMIVLKRLVR